MRAFARTDGELEREIREDVLEHALSVPRGRVDALVREGNVTLSGRIETAELEELLVSLVRKVLGVLSVESTVTHEHVEPRWPSAPLFTGSPR